jgi:hypothetical protein
MPALCVYICPSRQQQRGATVVGTVVFSIVSSFTVTAKLEGGHICIVVHAVHVHIAAP